MILLEHEIDEHSCGVCEQAIRRKIDVLLVCSEESLEDEISVELNSHNTVDFGLVDVFEDHEEVIS